MLRSLRKLTYLVVVGGVAKGTFGSTTMGRLVPVLGDEVRPESSIDRNHKKYNVAELQDATTSAVCFAWWGSRLSHKDPQSADLAPAQGRVGR